MLVARGGAGKMYGCWWLLYVSPAWRRDVEVARPGAHVPFIINRDAGGLSRLSHALVRALRQYACVRLLVEW